MYHEPYMLFHDRTGFKWDDKVDPKLQELDSLNDAPTDLLPTLTINVSQPDALMTWLNTNNAALITSLSVFVEGVVEDSPSPQQWRRLFDKLQHEAINLRDLTVYWDAAGPWGDPKPWQLDEGSLHFGLGRSMVFIRGLAQLKVKDSVEIGGFYAYPWPRYLEEKMGLKPVENHASHDFWQRMRRDFQVGTERLNPWVDPQDGSSASGVLGG